MRHFGLAAALLVLSPSIAAAAPAWHKATATSVNAGVNTRSTFVIQAYVTLPQSCYATHIRTYAITSQLNRSFVVEQMGPSPACKGPANYKCAVSASFMLPIEHKFDVFSKGYMWIVRLAMKPPTPIEPQCRKS